MTTIRNIVPMEETVLRIEYSVSAKKYFNGTQDRKCKPTVYALQQGAFIDNSYCYWCLRSLGDFPYYAADVYTGGALNIGGDYVDDVDRAVRPALRIRCNL